MQDALFQAGEASMRWTKFLSWSRRLVDRNGRVPCKVTISCAVSKGNSRHTVPPISYVCCMLIWMANSQSRRNPQAPFSVSLIIMYWYYSLSVVLPSVPQPLVGLLMEVNVCLMSALQVTDVLFKISLMHKTNSFLVLNMVSRCVQCFMMRWTWVHIDFMFCHHFSWQ